MIDVILQDLKFFNNGVDKLEDFMDLIRMFYSIVQTN